MKSRRTKTVLILDAEGDVLRAGIARRNGDEITWGEVVNASAPGVDELGSCIDALKGRTKGALPARAVVVNDRCAVAVAELPLSAVPRKGAEDFDALLSRRALPGAMDQWAERRLGTILRDRGSLGGERLRELLRLQAEGEAGRRLGELAEVRQLLSQEELDQALDEQGELQATPDEIVVAGAPLADAEETRGPFPWLMVSTTRRDWDDWSRRLRERGIKKWTLTRGAVASAVELRHATESGTATLVHEELGSVVVVEHRRGRTRDVEVRAITDPGRARSELGSALRSTGNATWCSGRGVGVSGVLVDEGARVLEERSGWTAAMRGAARATLLGGEALPGPGDRHEARRGTPAWLKAAVVPLLVCALVLAAEFGMKWRAESKAATIAELERRLAGGRRERTEARDAKSRARELALKAAERREELERLDDGASRIEAVLSRREKFWTTWLEAVRGAVTERVVLDEVELAPAGRGVVSGFASDVAVANRLVASLTTWLGPLGMEVARSQLQMREGPFGENSCSFELRIGVREEPEVRR